MASTTAPEKRGAEAYTAGEMTALLNEWARVVGSWSMYAAMHLLTYTELPGRRDFARHVEITTGYAADESEPLSAVTGPPGPTGAAGATGASGLTGSTGHTTIR